MALHISRGGDGPPAPDDKQVSPANLHQEEIAAQIRSLFPHAQGAIVEPIYSMHVMGLLHKLHAFAKIHEKSDLHVINERFKIEIDLKFLREENFNRLLHLALYLKEADKMGRLTLESEELKAVVGHDCVPLSICAEPGSIFELLTQIAEEVHLPKPDSESLKKSLLKPGSLMIGTYEDGANLSANKMHKVRYNCSEKMQQLKSRLTLNTLEVYRSS